MAVVNFLVSNPTNANITTNGKTALANDVTELAFDDAALVNGLNDLKVFVDQGCIIARSTITTEQMEEAADDLRHGAVPGH
jgi:hypothetical protein